MRLIIVRHGETEYNKQGRYMGQKDIPLNQLGREQAKKVAARLAKEKIEYIYSSDLKRCKETLQHILEELQGKPVFYDTILRERNVGDFEGKLREEVDWNSLPGNALTRKPPRGESLTDMKGRINRFLKHLQNKHVGENVLLVTHGGVIRILHHLLMRESLADSFEKYRPENTSIYIYEVTKGKPLVVSFNDVAHLK